MNFLRPYKSDVKQIQALTNLGTNQSDICSVLGISQDTLNKWKAKSAEVDQILKPKVRPEYTLAHPEYAAMVEEAFTCAGKRFYRFKDEFRMSTGRYKYYYATLREMDLRMSLEKLNEFIGAFEKCLNGTNAKKEVKLGDLWQLVFNMKSRISLAFEPSMIKNLAAVAYFDETEDLTTFDKKYGEAKIKLWEDNHVYDFFLTKPIGELFNLNDYSITSLQEYLREAEQMMADLNYNLQKVSEDNL